LNYSPCLELSLLKKKKKLINKYSGSSPVLTNSKKPTSKSEK
jgi:hypothetical protein